jgi:hypothetical protein
LGKRFSIVNEIKALNDHALYNEIKPLFSEDRLPLNIKYGKAEIDNHHHIWMFSNHRNPFPIEEGNKRIWYSHSNAKPKEGDDWDEYWPRFHEAVGQGLDEIGPEIPHFYHYLETEILPSLPANFAYIGSPETKASAKAITASKNPFAVLIEDGLASGEGFFASGVWFQKSDFMAYLRDPKEDHGVSHMMKKHSMINSILDSHGLREARAQVSGDTKTIAWFDPDETHWREDLFKDTSREGLTAKQKQCYDPRRRVCDQGHQ